MKDFKKKINGHDYYLNQWDAMRAMKLQFELIEVFGEAMVRTLAGGVNKDQIINQLGMGLILSVQKNPNDKVIELIEEVVKSSIRDGERINSIGTTYKSPEDLAEMYAVFVWVLQANFADFFEQAKDIFSDPENWSVSD